MCGSHLCGDGAIRTPNQGLNPFALLLRLITPYISRTVLSTMCTSRKSKALRCASPCSPANLHRLAGWGKKVNKAIPLLHKDIHP